MFKWPNIFKKEVEVNGAKSARPASIPITSGSLLDLALNGSRITDSKAMSLYRQNSALATAVDLIASNFEQIMPVLKGPDGKIVENHEVIDLLKQPNGFQTWSQLAGELGRYYLITADSYLSGLGNIRRPPLEIYAVKPQLVMATEDTRDSFPAQYFVTIGVGRGVYSREEKRGTVRFLSGVLKEIYHIMGFSSRSSNIQGDSLVQAIALEINQKIKGLNHNLKLIENGGRLSLIVSFKDEDHLKDDEHQERKQRINEDLSGSENAGRIAVISGADTNISEVGKSNKDMDYATLDNIATQSIYLRYKIPLPLVSNDASTFNNFSAAIALLFDQAVIPLADVVFSGLSKFLLPRYGLDPSKYSITFDPLSITALKSRMLEELKLKRDINIETINELRSGMAKDPVEGGDDLYQPANLIPVGEDLLKDEAVEDDTEDL